MQKTPRGNCQRIYSCLPWNLVIIFFSIKFTFLFSRLDDGSVEIPVEISGIIDDTKSLDLKSSESREDEIVVSEVDASKEVEVKVELDSNERSGENENEDIDISEATVYNNEEEPRTKEEEPRTKEEDETEEATNVAEVKHKIDGGSLAQNDEEKKWYFLLKRRLQIIEGR